MTLYFCSVRERDKDGPTVCAGHFLGDTALDARVAAEKEFFRKVDFSDVTDQSTQKFLEGVVESQIRLRSVGFVVICRKSKSAAKDCL